MERTCQRCGAHFQIPAAWVRKGSGRFCSRDCYSAHQRENPHTRRGKEAVPSVTKTCPECGETFTTRGSRPRRHCSRACATQSRRVSKTCLRCERQFSVPASSAARYLHCSIECSRADVEYAACPRCGAVFATKGGHLKHCSEECRRPPQMLDCPVCGKTTRVVPSNRQRFCSVRCYRRHTGETEPESNVRQALEVLGEQFSQEHSIAGWSGPVDFFIRSRSLVIEVDEPYWHDRVKDRDARKDIFMQSRGYAVLRLVATPFYGDLTDGMVHAIRAALRVTENTVPAHDVLGLHPLQLALPFDQERVIGGCRN